MVRKDGMAIDFPFDSLLLLEDGCELESFRGRTAGRLQDWTNDNRELFEASRNG